MPTLCLQILIPAWLPRNTWVLDPRWQTVTFFSNLARVCECVCVSMRVHVGVHTLHGRLEPG